MRHLILALLLAAGLSVAEDAIPEAAREAFADARTLRDRLNYTDAIAGFDVAIELAPGYADAFYERGICYLKIGQFMPGILDFSRALELNPRRASEVYTKVYQISYVVDLDRVVRELDKHVEAQPKAAHVVFMRGFFHVAKVEYKQAGVEDVQRGIADFDATLALNPKHVTALLYRAHLFTERAGLEPAEGERWRSKARADLAEALRHDPTSELAAYLEGRLWARRLGEDGASDVDLATWREKALSALQLALERGFTGYERLKTDKAFDALREDARFRKLLEPR